MTVNEGPFPFCVAETFERDFPEEEGVMFFCFFFEHYSMPTYFNSYPK